MSDDSDIQLIINYLKGDDKSLEVLISRYLKPIYGFVYRFTNNIQDTDDITQEVFVKVWKNLKKFDQTKNFKTWLFTIAKNTAIDWLRRHRDIVFSDLIKTEDGESLENNIIDDAPLPSEIFERQHLAQELNLVVGKLPAIYQTVLSLYYKEEFTLQEVSEILGESVNTVKSRHWRAIKALRKELSI
ncbi:MAG: sigma-70 family RNA polymerase sigma factor [Patescibacteria group bacterium]